MNQVKWGEGRIKVLVVMVLAAVLVAGAGFTSRGGWVTSAHADSREESLVRNGVPYVPAIVRRVMPAVVNISTTRVIKGGGNMFNGMPGPFGMPIPDGRRKRRENSLGSGVIVDGRGYIITNYHVVDKADEISVVLADKRKFKAKIVGTDPKTDIAIIKINARHLPVVRWGNSDALEIGESVLAIGSPYGLSQTVTRGIVSAKGRANVGILDYENFIQTDAAINPGNSGGALVNMRGELVGINTAIFSRSGGSTGIGFAVPANMARQVMGALINQGKVTRGWLGVSIQDLDPALARNLGLDSTDGVLVSDIIPDTPAARAGVRSGDVIIRFDGKSIGDAHVLRNVVAATPVGKRVFIEVVRKGARKRLSVYISEQPKQLMRASRGHTPGKIPAGTAFVGVEVTNMTARIAGQLGVNSAEGVVVTDVEVGTPAERAGLRSGDVILSIKDRPTNSVNTYRRMASQLKPGQSIMVRINRRGNKRFLSVSP